MELEPVDDELLELLELLAELLLEDGPSTEIESITTPERDKILFCSDAPKSTASASVGKASITT